MSEYKEDEVVLCAANGYNKKFYLNDSFSELPENIKDELQIMCVLYTEDVGGILELVYNEDGELEFRTSCEENDFFYDEIGSVLKIKEIRKEKAELLQSLELYYKVVILKQVKPEDLE